jgi:hypothetical protein
MNQPTNLLLTMVAPLLLGGCYSSYPTPAAPSAPPQTRVQVPSAAMLRPIEQRMLPEFVDALKDAGYTPVETPAEFIAEFRINEGPINAETRMNLAHRGESLAYAASRLGGPAKLFRGDQYAERSFFDALRKYEHQLPRASAFGRGNRYPVQSVNYPDPPEDWRTGW